MTKQEREYNKRMIEELTKRNKIMIEELTKRIESMSPNRRIYGTFIKRKNQLEEELKRSKSHRRWQKRRRKNRKKKARMK